MKRERVRLETIEHVDALEIDELAPGTRHQLWVRLVRDALSQPISVPVLVVRGKKPGPVFGITAALHGNEINGIPVIHRLFDDVDVRQLRGTLVGVPVVNVQSYEANTREFIDGVDLNHVMPGRPDGNVHEVYAWRLLERVVSQFDYLIDLHTASFGRINSLYVRATMTDPLTARMAYLLHPQIILHNPPSDRTLRGAATEVDHFGSIPAITVEIGDPQVFQPKKIASTISGIRRVLSAVGMLPKRKLVLGPPPVICERSRWVYTDYGGLLEVPPAVMEFVEKNEVIGRLRDIFGALAREYLAPEAGIVIGKSVNPVGQTGARILHLGILAPPDAYPLDDIVLLGERP